MSSARRLLPDEGNEVRTDLLPEMLKNRAKVNATSKKINLFYNKNGFDWPYVGIVAAADSQVQHFLEIEFEAKVAETFAEIHTFCAQHLALDLGVQGPSYDHDRFMAADEEAERANARRHATKIEADYEHERLQAALRYSMVAAKAAHLAFYQFMKPRAARQAPPLCSFSQSSLPCSPWPRPSLAARALWTIAETARNNTTGR
jgi:hypothetical protein